MGMDPRAFTVRLEHARGSGGRARTLIYLIEGEGQRLYLKHDPEQREEVFRASQEAHAVVERALWASDGFGIVPILHSDVQERVVVMPFIEGQSARERLILAREGAGRPADILRDCGRWLSHLHENAGPLVETRDFKWIARRARTFAERVRSGAQAVAHPKRFLGLCAMVHRLVREMQDQPVHLSGLHGDAHAANFIYADEGLIAIDVTGRGHGPRVWDLARLLARYLYNLGRDPKGSEQWAGLRMEDLDALSVGYQRGRADRAGPVAVSCADDDERLGLL